MITLKYNRKDINEERKCYEILTVRLGMDIDATLQLMNDPIADANAETWAVELKQTTNVYKQWAADIWLTRGEQVTHNGIVYNVIQSHQSQADWQPALTASLFRPVPVQYPGENYPRWRQPIDSEDAYKLDERVTHNAEDWKSNVAANVWEPPTQWTSLTNPPVGYPAWAPWPGSGPTYQIGDRVTHNGFNWEATVGNNVWEPGVFGWVQI